MYHIHIYISSYICIHTLSMHLYMYYLLFIFIYLLPPVTLTTLIWIQHQRVYSSFSPFSISRPSFFLRQTLVSITSTDVTMYQHVFILLQGAYPQALPAPHHLVCSQGVHTLSTVFTYLLSLLDILSVNGGREGGKKEGTRKEIERQVGRCPQKRFSQCTHIPELAWWLRTHLPTQETWVQSLGQGKIPWRWKWLPTPAFLPGEIPRTEEPGELQFIGWQRVRHDLTAKQQQKLTFQASRQSSWKPLLSAPVITVYLGRIGRLQTGPKIFPLWIGR